MASLWLRLYTEIIYDSKLRRLPPSRRWLWITLLCIAKVSPRPGWLLLAEGVPVTVKDIADKAAVTVNIVKAGLSDFTYLRMVEKVDGVWRLLNWDKRQFVSDNSRARVQKHRKKGKVGSAGSDTVTAAGKVAAAGNTSPNPNQQKSKIDDANGSDVTLPERYHNVTRNPSVTPPETETENKDREQKKNTGHTSTTAITHKGKKTALVSAFEQEFGRLLSPVELEQLGNWDKNCPEPLIREGLKRAVLAGKYQFRYINGILTNWRKNNLRTVQEITAHEASFRNKDRPELFAVNKAGKARPGYRPSEADWAHEPDTL
ncbi:MAG: DnaD domain protein [Peptococcaceae bacterium]|nr:DnaD domain protein [Candidatus Syntrophopropionicum ammoniitolerans]